MGGLRELVIARGRAGGLDAVGFADAGSFHRTRDDLLARRAAGLAADMQFTYRNPDRSTDPSATLPGARTLVVGVVRYGSERPPASPVPPRGAVGAVPCRPLGRVARYAVGDHDAVLRRALGAVADDLRNAGHRAVVLADDNALVDRAAAYRAGLGWFGKSSNFLVAGRGSWFVLGSVLTDAAFPPATDRVADGCGTCRRCVDACPTGAIVADGVVDARRCLSWLLQSPGTFPREHRIALGDRIYGCDDCQEVCPPNRAADRRGEGGGKSGGEAGVGVRVLPRSRSVDGQGWVDILDMLAADDDELLATAGRWYVPGRDPLHLRRNALLVLGNTADGADPDVEATLNRYLRHPDPLLVSHAAWAAMRLGRGDLLAAADLHGSTQVREEVDAWGSGG